MSSFLPTAVKFLRDFFISILLWAYAGILVLTWHVAWRTPEWAVLLRVAASVLNDLVWVPLGVLVWSFSAVTALRLLGIRPRREFGMKTGVVITAVMFHGLFPGAAFRFLFVPLAGAVLILAGRSLSGRRDIHVAGRYLPFVVIVALTMGHYQRQMLPGFRTAPSGGTITVMSYNIYRDGGLEDRMNVIETIRRENADIVCCIEYNAVRDGALFSRRLGDMYPYSVLSDTRKNMKSGSVIFSKYPIEKRKTDELNRMRNQWSSLVSIIYAEVDLDGRKITVVNYHLKSVGHYIEYIAGKDYALRDKMDRAAGYESKYDREKFIQARALVELASASPEPVILCGDLNDTPNSRAFHTLQRKYANAFSAAGWGIGTTFGEMRIREKFRWMPVIPLLARDVIRIDHIFTDDSIRAVDAKVLSGARGSDHKPVVAVLEIGEPGPRAGRGNDIRD